LSPVREGGVWGAALLYAALTFVLAYPLSVHLADGVLSTSADTDLFLWTLSWDVHALTHRPWSIFQANIFHPQHNTLAYSENLIGSAFFAAPILWLTGNAVLAMNLVVFLSAVLCGVGTYVLTRRIGISAEGGLLAGLVFAFAPPRFLRLDQLFLATVQWIPFSLAFLHAYLERGRKSDLRVAAGLFTLQATTSGHGAVFLAVAALMLVMYRMALGHPSAFMKQLLLDLGWPGALVLAPVMLLGLPYRAVQAEMGLRRSLDDWAVLVPQSFLASPTYVQAFLLSRVAPGMRINETANAYLFPGWVSLLLALAAVVVRRPRRLADDRTRRRSWWSLAAFALDLVTIVGLILGLAIAAKGQFRLRIGAVVLFSARQAWRPWLIALVGAVLRIAIRNRAPFSPPGLLHSLTSPGRRWLGAAGRWRRAAGRWRRAAGRWRRAARLNPKLFYLLLIVLSVWLAIGPPYSLWPFVYWWPGFNFIRVSSRFMLLTVLGIGVLAGAGFDALTARLDGSWRRLAGVLAGGLMVMECLVPLGPIQYRVDTPGADRWLATRPQPFAVAEVPLPPLSQVAFFEKRQSTYMLHSTAHWGKTVHGWSGLQPPHHLDLYDALGQFPDEESLRMLGQFGVDFVVVHCDLYPAGEWPEVERRIQSFQSRLRPAYADDTARVYALGASGK
jgi:hypothetical protein